MTDRLADDHARRRALDPARSFIVQAPAGSGKTELLVRRFLVLLAAVTEPERIVAITFTRKAAAEMRARVIEALTLARGPQPVGPETETLWHLARAVLANDERHGWQLQTYPTRLRIQTIDALSAALTRQMPWLSRFGSPMRIVEDADELYREAAIATLRRLGSGTSRRYRALADLVAHLDNNLPRLTGLLVVMLRHRDQWLRHVIRHGQNPEQRNAAERAWTGLAESVLREARDLIPASRRARLAELAGFAGDSLTVSHPDSPIVACRGLDTIPPALASRISQWRGLAELLLTKTNAWRRNVNVNQGFPPGLEQRREMLALLEALSEESDLRSRLTEIRRLPGPRFEERQWQVLESLIEVLPFAAAELQLVFRERGQVDFPEITESARLALGACEQPTELALRLDYRIEHLLVDEFQDTSVSQFELLGQLTLGWQSGDGRTLFLVGDPMQSIYRFRDAEVGLFLRVMQSGWGQIPMETLTLTVNFRSDQSIVAWVNRTFPELFPGRNEPARGAVTYVPFAYHDESPVGRGVAIHPIAAGPEQEAARVVELVRAALDDPGQESIAILVRSRRHLSAILPALKHAGVNYHGVDLVPLSDRPVIIDLMALVRALLMPADRLAWLAILRAPWCGLTLADLYVLAADTGGSVLESLVDANRHALLSSEGRARVERCTVVLKRALAARGRGTFRTWVENAWIALGGPACVDADQLVDAETFFALLSEHEVAADLIDLSQLHRAVGRLWSRPDPSAGERVQVMTLHKAKGLEFDTVIIPGLARVPPMESTKLLIWEEYAQGDESVLLLAPVTEPGQEHDPHYQFLRRLHSQKEEFETLRLLYVGCTRARHALNLLGQVKLDDAGALRAPVQRSLQRRLWPLFEEALADRAARVGSVQLELLRAEREVEHPPQLMRLAQDWRPPPRPEMIPGHADLTLDTPGDAVEFAWAGETARQIGVLVHSVLQWMGEEGLANWDEQRLNEHRVQWHCELTAAGVPEVDVEAALERVMSALSNVMSDPQAAWILKRDHHTPSNELKITTYRDGQLQNLVIDRTFIDASGVRWIIDYKTSSHEGGNTELFLDREVGRYRAQLETYAEALGADDTRPIRLGLYFPLLRGWREWGYP